MAFPKTIHLCRHGETSALPGTLLGSTDLSLNAEGEKQGKALRDELKRMAPDLILSSPLTRARETIGSLDHKVLSELKEINFGEWEMKRPEDLMSDPLMESWSRFDDDFSFPGGESLKSFLGRVQKVLSYLLRAPAEEIVLVSHGGMIRQLLCLILGLTPKQYLIFSIEYGTLSRLKLFENGRGLLMELNRKPC